MIVLTDIEMNESHDRAPIYRYGQPIGMTRGDIARDVVIRMRITDTKDLDRIRSAVADLVAGPAADAEDVDKEPRALPA